MKRVRKGRKNAHVIRKKVHGIHRLLLFFMDGRRKKKEKKADFVPLGDGCVGGRRASKNTKVSVVCSFLAHLHDRIIALPACSLKREKNESREENISNDEQKYDHKCNHKNKLSKKNIQEENRGAMDR